MNRSKQKKEYLITAIIFFVLGVVAVSFFSKSLAALGIIMIVVGLLLFGIGMGMRKKKSKKTKGKKARA